MRERYDDITKLGADVIAIGTGDQRYAAAFVRDERIPFRVLVDDHSTAAEAASVRTLNWFQLLHPRTWAASRQASKNGHHIHNAGKRVRQIGATFVVGAGDRVRYEHLDADSTDHANLDEVLAVLREN